MLACHGVYRAATKLMLLQQRREATHRTESIAENQPLEIPSVDDPFVVSKVTEFYNHLYGFSMVKCTLLYYDACVNYAMQES